MAEKIQEVVGDEPFSREPSNAPESTLIHLREENKRMAAAPDPQGKAD